MKLKTYNPLFVIFLSLQCFDAVAQDFDYYQDNYSYFQSYEDSYDNDDQQFQEDTDNEDSFRSGEEEALLMEQYEIVMMAELQHPIESYQGLYNKAIHGAKTNQTKLRCFYSKSQFFIDTDARAGIVKGEFTAALSHIGINSNAEFDFNIKSVFIDLSHPDSLKEISTPCPKQMTWEAPVTALSSEENDGNYFHYPFPSVLSQDVEGVLSGDFTMLSEWNPSYKWIKGIDDIYEDYRNGRLTNGKNFIDATWDYLGFDFVDQGYVSAIAESGVASIRTAALNSIGASSVSVGDHNSGSAASGASSGGAGGAASSSSNGSGTGGATGGAGARTSGGAGGAGAGGGGPQ